MIQKLNFILTFLMMAASAVASNPSDCIKKADEARAEMLRFKDGKSSDSAVSLSTKAAGLCIDQIEAKEKKQLKDKAVVAWKAFQTLREEKILPTVVRYNKTTKDNKVNLDKTKDALRAFGNNSAAVECIDKADKARAALLLYKDGKGDEGTVNQTAQDTSTCIEALDAKGKVEPKAQALAAWKTFRAIREGKIIPDVKYFMEQSNLNTANLTKTKEALRELTTN